ncbi:MAG: hypothetical protein ACT4NY_02300 [Pseudonocardiales bacterium]
MPDEYTRDAVAWVCTNVADIRGCLKREGDTSPLDRLIAAVCDGGEVSELISELHIALQRCGDARGVGSTRGGGHYRGARPVGMDDPPPVEVVFLCPRGKCSRSWLPDPATPPSTPPTCQLYSEPLRWERL